MFRKLGGQMPLNLQSPEMLNILSCDWQVYLGCDRCSWEDRWDNGFGVPGESAEPTCPNCAHEHPGLRPIVRHLFSLEVMCRECQTWSELVALDLGDIQCRKCSSRHLVLYGFRVAPEFPKEFGEAPVMKAEPWGHSGKNDGTFILQQIQGFNLFPDRAFHFLPLIRLCERLRWASQYPTEDDLGLIWNIEGNLLRDYFRESQDVAAGVGAIESFEESVRLTGDPVQRGLVEHNIAMACYSLLAKEPQEFLSAHGAPGDLRATGLRHAQTALDIFETGAGAGQPYSAGQAARIHFIVGDLLQVGSPTNAELLDAIRHYDVAAREPAIGARTQAWVRARRSEAVLRTANPPMKQLEAAIAQLEAMAAREETDRAFSEKWPVIGNLGTVYLRTGQLGKAKEKFEYAGALALHEIEQVTDEGTLGVRTREYATVFDALFRLYVAEGKPLEALASMETIRAATLAARVRSHAEAQAAHQTAGSLAVTRVLGALLGEGPAHVSVRELSLPTSRTREACQQFISTTPGTALIALSVHAGHVSTVVVLPDGRGEPRFETMNWPITPEEFGGLENYHLVFEASPLRERRLQRFCTKLSNVLLGSIPEQLRQTRVSRLCFCLPGILSHWPLEACRPTGDETLGDSYSCSYVPSLRVAQSLCERRAKTVEPRILVVPYLGADLKETAPEIEALRRIGGATVHVMTAEGLTKTALLDEMAQGYGYVHFACHGTFDVVDPLESALDLNQDRPGDAFKLRARDVLSLELPAYPVITMSACSSALTSFDRANSFTGLSGGLLRAGARAVIGSRWDVHDDTGCQFMTRLYELMFGEGLSPADSVSRAQREFRRHQPIEDWASFSLMGVP
jgi:hypothetical protein